MHEKLAIFYSDKLNHRSKRCYKNVHSRFHKPV